MGRPQTRDDNDDLDIEDAIYGREAAEKPDSLECPMCGGKGRVFRITEAINAAVEAGAVTIQPVRGAAASAGADPEPCRCYEDPDGWRAAIQAQRHNGHDVGFRDPECRACRGAQGGPSLDVPTLAAAIWTASSRHDEKPWVDATEDEQAETRQWAEEILIAARLGVAPEPPDPMAGHGPFNDFDGVDVCSRCNWRSDEPPGPCQEQAR